MRRTLSQEHCAARSPTCGTRSLGLSLGKPGLVGRPQGAATLLHCVIVMTGLVDLMHGRRAETRGLGLDSEPSGFPSEGAGATPAARSHGAPPRPERLVG